MNVLNFKIHVMQLKQDWKGALQVEYTYEVYPKVPGLAA
jgi:outer membrane phospholipase A